MGRRNRDKLLGSFPDRLQRGQIRTLKEKHIAKAVDECNLEGLMKGRLLTNEEVDEITKKHLERFKKERDENRK